MLAFLYVLSEGVHPLGYQAKDGDRAHEEHGIVKLEEFSISWRAREERDQMWRTARLETDRSSSSVLASINRRRRLGKLALREREWSG